MDARPDLESMGAAGDGSADGGGGKVSRVADTATSAAGDVASTVGDEAKKVTSTAAEQARSVVQEAKGQVGNLVDQARSELRTQSSERGTQAAQGLRTLSGQLQALTDGRPADAGPLGDYLDQARSQVSSLAWRLDQGGIEGVLGDVSNFARRRPGLFLVMAAGAGFVAGRMVRSGVRVAQADGNGSGSDQGGRRVALPVGAPGELAPTGLQVP